MVPLGAPKAPSENRPANSSPPKAARQLLMETKMADLRWRIETKMAEGRGKGRVKGGRGKWKGGGGRGKGEGVRDRQRI